MPKILSALTLAVFFLSFSAIADSQDDSLSKARDFIKAMGFEEKTIAQMSDEQFIKQSGVFLKEKIVEANPGKEQEISGVYIKVYRSIFPKFIPDYMEYYANLYAQKFTAQEIDQLTSFYKTEVMKKLLQSLSFHRQFVPTAQEKSQMQAFSQTTVGQKEPKIEPEIRNKMQLYAVDVIRPKLRNLLYNSLREELPKNGLHVPDPFKPDTFIDQTLHDNVAYTDFPSGYLVPASASIPKGFYLFSKVYRADSYALQYNTDDNIGRLIIGEIPDAGELNYNLLVNNSRKMIQKPIGASRVEEIKKVNYMGAQGILFLETAYKNIYYDLVLNDKGKFLRISTMDGTSFHFSPDNIEGILKSFVRQS
jgi:hypothetical protein